MPFFFTDPDGNLLSAARVGGVKAVASGFVILGTGDDEVLCYTETPPDVAIKWRDALSLRLIQGYRGRRERDIDWLALATEINPEWAAERGYPPSPSDQALASAAQPVRRGPRDVDISEM